MDVMFVEALGFAAGATTLVSSVPQLIANLRDQALALGQSLSRNCLQAAGNALWFVYGTSVGSASMITFAGLGCLMASCLALQTYRVQFRGFRMVGDQLASVLGGPAT